MSGFVARRFLQLTIALAVCGCAQNLPAPRQTGSGTSPTSVPPATHLYGNDFMYSSQPSGNEVDVYKRKRRSPTR